MRCLHLMSGREGREDREKKGRVLSGGRGCVLGRMSEFTGGNRGGERR